MPDPPLSELRQFEYTFGHLSQRANCAYDHDRKSQSVYGIDLLCCKADFGLAVEKALPGDLSSRDANERDSNLTSDMTSGESSRLSQMFDIP